MPSALTPNGSTHQWRQLRAAATAHLAAIGTTPCAATHHHPNCTGTITPTTPWALGHRDPRATGGTDQHLQYEHRSCSNAEGGRLQHQLRKHRNSEASQPHWLLEGTL